MKGINFRKWPLKCILDRKNFPEWVNTSNLETFGDLISAAITPFAVGRSKKVLIKTYIYFNYKLSEKKYFSREKTLQPKN